MNIISAVTVLFLSVIGAATVCRFLSLRLFSVKDEYTVMYVTVLKNVGENAEFVLRSALSKHARGVKTVCLDCKLDGKTRSICEAVCREYGVDCLMTKDEFLKSLDYS